VRGILATLGVMVVVSSATAAAQEEGEQVLQELRSLGPQCSKALRSRIAEHRERGASASDAVLRTEDTPAVLAPLGERIEVSGGIRTRAEYRSLVDYKTAAGMDRSDDFALLRTRLNFDVGVNDRVRALVQVQDSRKFGEEESTTSDEAGVDLHQAYFNMELNPLGNVPLTVRLGRQEMRLGSGRFVAECPWSNVGRSFDGLRLTWKAQDWDVHLFGMLVQEAGAGSTDDDRAFAGLHATRRHTGDHIFDVYAYYRHFADGSFTGETGTSGDLRDVSVGARALGRHGAWDCEGEIAFQTGERAEDDVKAWMAVARLGHTFRRVRLGPRLGLEYNFASGDEDPADGTRQGFDDLFGLRHFVLGIADYTGRSNLHDFVVQVAAKSSESWKLRVDYHVFRLAERRDAWRACNLSVMQRDPTGAADPSLGSELDICASCELDNMRVSFGGARFFAGPYVKELTGRDQDATWLFVQCEARF